MNFVRNIGKLALRRERAREDVPYGEDLFRQIVEYAPNANILFDATGRIVFVNLEVERLFGYSRAELLGQKIETLFPERLRANHPDWRRAFFANPQVVRLGARDFYGLKKDGVEFPIATGLTPIDTSKGMLALIAIVDITTKFRLEERLRQVVESIPNAIVMSDAGGTIRLVNTEAERLTGYSRSELLGQPLEMLTPERGHARIREFRKTFFAAPQARGLARSPNPIRRKDGSEIVIEYSLTPIQTDDGIMALTVSVDITENRRLEELSQQVVENAPNAIVMLSTEGTIKLVNAEAERLFGYGRSEMMGQPASMLVPERFHVPIAESRTRFFVNADAKSARRNPDSAVMKKKDGSEFPVEQRFNVIETDEGSMVLAAIVDVSERRRLEERFRQVVEFAPNAMLMVDIDGKINLTNKEAERLFGYSREELLGQRMEMLAPERFHAAMVRNRAKFFESPLALSLRPGTGPDTLKKKDGTEFPAEYGVNPIYADDGLKALVALVDVTERLQAKRRLEEQARDLMRSNAELEQFAYVASHDLKAPMRGIDNAAKWLETDLQGKLSGEEQKILDLMRNRISRMERLLDDLLAYSRAGRTDTAVQRTPIVEVLENIVQILAAPDRIRIRAEGKLPVIHTARAQLEQILRNLISNAIKHHNKPQGEIVVSAREVGNMVEFSVRDDGPGIPREYHETIFKLFQTLKRRDEVEGSGMGLAIVKKLVDQQRGTITVHSEGNDTGTEFRILWPLVASPGESGGLHA